MDLEGNAKEGDDDQSALDQSSTEENPPLDLIGNQLNHTISQAARLANKNSMHLA
jgi:hypothetical protein